MAAISPATVAELPPEIPQWLKNLPLAPEYHPTLEEFQDPISYILKIEKEASKYGICKIIPPVPPPPKKTAITNLNRSLAARNPNHNPKSQPTFTTRHQQIGFCPRKLRPVQRPVWQSGESYTVQQFEAKAKHFEKTHLKKGGKKGFSSLEIETLFWKASVDKPFTVEYANDMPGSAFVPINEKKWREAGEAATVGETAWNMRGVSRAKGSLLRFMKEEIPGVTSPMVYLAMMFSWFAWHVEDHDLHSLNYMHLGAGKTWYGVPRDAAVAFEEVIRVHGYGGEVNPLVTFATLGEKTTVMSPEVLIVAGIPCCRLVQNVGEFVVTFPRAYHSGFSHGFNCGEAANIATPEWLTVAKEAAIRRASVNYPPMVSHFQLLYALALTLCSRVPMSIDSEPRSSRLKDKKRGEGQTMVKELFVQNMIQNNDLLHILLEQGTSCVLLPQNSSEMSLCSNSRVGSQVKVKPRLSLGLGSNEDGASKDLHSNDIMLDRNESFRHLSGFSLVRRKSSYGFERDSLGPSSARNANCGLGLRPSTSVTPDVDTERGSISQGAGSLDQGLFSCVTCGILNFACAVVIQPKEEAAQYFMSADCSFFNDWTAGSGATNDRFTVANGKGSASNINFRSGGKENCDPDDGLYDVPIQSGEYQIQVADEKVEVVSDTGKDKVISSLDLLAFAYGNSSDSEEEERVEPDTMLVSADEGGMGDCSPLSNEKNEFLSDDPGLHSHEAQLQVGTTDKISLPSSRIRYGNEDSIRTYQRNRTSRRKQNWSHNIKGKGQEIVDCSIESDSKRLVNMESNGFQGSCRDSMVASGRMVAESAEVDRSDVKMERVECRPTDYLGTSNSSHILLNCSVDAVFPETIKSSNIVPLVRKSDEESSRRHIFCLEHAIEVEKQLRPIGGVDMLLLCHPEYPRVEAEAKSLAEELRENYVWKDIPFREASITDREIIRAALDDEEAIPSNGDWAVKLGINLYYSVSLSQSPLYSKQMPYNAVIYKAFGRSSPGNSPTKPKASGRGFNKQKKIVVAGKWCGKVWMSNQVHPFLVQRDIQEERPVSFHARTMPDSKLEGKPNMQVEEPPQNSLSDITTIISRKVTQKRKRTLGKGTTTKRPKSSKVDSPVEDEGTTTKRPKSSKVDSPVEDEGTTTKRPKSSKVDSPVEDAEEFPEDNSPPEDDNSPPPEEVDNSPPRGGRILRSCLTKHGSPPPRKSSARSIRRSYDSGLKDESDQGGPSTRLRRRRASQPAEEVVKEKPVRDKKTKKKNRTLKKGLGNSSSSSSGNNELALKDAEAEYQCDMEGCSMGFNTKQELIVHKRNICSVKGCGKKFFSHKYLIQHRRVHMDDRPLKCPWRGCKMTFKWAWARTEHIRVHTGARPYVCREPGCGQTFRFVSDFSRHKRKTGHAVKGKG